MKIKNKKRKAKKICALCASVVKKLLKTAKMRQDLAEFGRTWQNGTAGDRCELSSMRLENELRKMNPKTIFAPDHHELIADL